MVTIIMTVVKKYNNNDDHDGDDNGDDDNDDTDSIDNDNDYNDHADNDTHTHPAGGLFVGHLMLVAGLHLQPLACPNHLDISSSGSFIRSLYRDYFELPKFRTFVSKTHLGAR
jgi:hypothetical protein